MGGLDDFLELLCRLDEDDEDDEDEEEDEEEEWPEDEEEDESESSPSILPRRPVPFEEMGSSLPTSWVRESALSLSFVEGSVATLGVAADADAAGGAGRAFVSFLKASGSLTERVASDFASFLVSRAVGAGEKIIFFLVWRLTSLRKALSIFSGVPGGRPGGSIDYDGEQTPRERGSEKKTQIRATRLPYSLIPERNPTCAGSAARLAAAGQTLRVCRTW